MCCFFTLNIRLKKRYWETAFRLGFLSSTNGCQLPVLHVFLAHSTCLLCSLMTVINLIMGRSFRRTNHVIAAFSKRQSVDATKLNLVKLLNRL